MQLRAILPISLFRRTAEFVKIPLNKMGCRFSFSPEAAKIKLRHQVWGCFAASGVGFLVFIDGILNADMCINIFKQNLLSSANKLRIRSTFKFYQDNDPKHKAKKTREWLLYNCPCVLETPLQSPDCNPVENLWDHLDREIRKTPLLVLPTFKERLRGEQIKIPVTYVRQLVSSMPRRLDAVIRAKGAHTKYQKQ